MFFFSKKSPANVESTSDNTAENIVPRGLKINSKLLLFFMKFYRYPFSLDKQNSFSSFWQAFRKVSAKKFVAWYSKFH